MCEAHIIPRGFARTLSKPGAHNRAVTASGSRRARQPHGDYDPSILCAACDGKLGAYDRAAVEICRAIPANRVGSAGQIIRLSPFDGRMFALAILAVLWRASLSARPTWAEVALGPYEDRAAEVLLGGGDLSALPEYKVVLGRYYSARFDTTGFISYPVRFRNRSFSAYGLSLGGFQVVAKLDRRPMPAIMRPFVINDAAGLQAYLMQLEMTPEFKWMSDVAQREQHRQSRDL